MRQRKSDSSNKVKRRGYLKGIAAAGIGASAVSTFSGTSAAATDNAMDADGDNVYLIFGADTSATDLHPWLKKHKKKLNSSSQQSSSQVIQYQDVTQLNVNQQKNAVAISIDGGKADAIQRTYQNNENTQAGSAESINAKEQTKEQAFENLNDVYVVLAGETDSREFSGWVVSDDAYQSEQTAEADIEQEQEVDQVNYSSQSTAISIAENGSYSRSYQRSFQLNENAQTAEALAANVGKGDKQNASSSVKQAQIVNQLNVNKQGVAIAVAVGKDSVAKAWQVSCQFNRNEQVASATAVNFDPKSVKEFTASANMKGDYSDSHVKRSKKCTSQSNKQGAKANIEQFQDVSQENISMQNAAIAIGLDGSEATATQASYQANFNAQVASATAVNVDEGTKKVFAVMDGTDAKGDNSWAVSYDNGSGQVTKQKALAVVKQAQYIEQLNVSEQTSAIAFATNDGNASAEQLNYQLNENIQAAESTAINTDSQHSNGKKNGEKNGKKNGKKGENGKKVEC
ncbi:hypothetical protein [Haladaptatus litoreus]|nr:hypothetical protein [Haladaptatus litoreus]